MTDALSGEWHCVIILPHRPEMLQCYTLWQYVLLSLLNAAVNIKYKA